MGVGGLGGGGGGSAEMANVRPQASLCASFPYYRERYLLRSVITNVKLQGLFFLFFFFFVSFSPPFLFFLLAETGGMYNSANAYSALRQVRLVHHYQ